MSKKLLSRGLKLPKLPTLLLPRGLARLASPNIGNNGACGAATPSANKEYSPCSSGMTTSLRLLLSFGTYGTTTATSTTRRGARIRVRARAR